MIAGDLYAMVFVVGAGAGVVTSLAIVAGHGRRMAEQAVAEARKRWAEQDAQMGLSDRVPYLYGGGSKSTIPVGKNPTPPPPPSPIEETMRQLGAGLTFKFYDKQGREVEFTGIVEAASSAFDAQQAHAQRPLSVGDRAVYKSGGRGTVLWMDDRWVLVHPVKGQPPQLWYREMTTRDEAPPTHE